LSRYSSFSLNEKVWDFYMFFDWLTHWVVIG
jgi:hypothetical protein